MTTITIALPPSVNSIWRFGRGGRVHKSTRYCAWQRTAGWELAAQRPKRVAGPVKVSIAAGRPDRRRRDIDNLSKSLLDLLQVHRVIKDDSMVTSLAARWDEAIPAGTVRVTVEAAMVNSVNSGSSALRT